MFSIKISHLVGFVGILALLTPYNAKTMDSEGLRIRRFQLALADSPESRTQHARAYIREMRESLGKDNFDALLKKIGDRLQGDSVKLADAIIKKLD